MSVSSDNLVDLLMICDMILGVSICIIILGVHVESVNEATSNAIYGNYIDGVHSRDGFVFGIKWYVQVPFDMFCIPLLC